MASNSFKVKNSLVLTPKDLSTLVSPEAGDLACDINDNNKIKRYDANAAAWVEVGSGGVGGVDIFFVQDFESASLSSFDSQVGLSLSQTDPLKGKVSAVLTHDSSIDQSFKQVLPVDRKFRGVPMVLRLDSKSSASQGNLVIKIYDETNSADIVASEQLQLSNEVSGKKTSVGFTIPESCASLSYTITALPESGSPVSRIDDIICEIAETALLETAVVVPNMTAWQGYTPTFQGFGTATNVEFEWRQVGENVEIRGKFTSGVSTAVEARVGLPAGLTSASTALIPSIQISGVSARNSITAASFYTLMEPSVSYLTLSAQSSSVASLTKLNGDSIASSGQSLSFFASVPCAGLSATTTKTIPLTQSGLVQEADSVLYAAGNAGQVITAGVSKIPFIGVLNKGSDISFNGTDVTVMVDGLYEFNVAMIFSADLSRRIAVYINGVEKYVLGDGGSNTNTNAGSITLDLIAGDMIHFRSSGSGGTLVNSTTFHFLRVTRQGSLKQVSVNPNSKITIPTSELRFEGASSRGSTATAIVRFDSVAKLRGDAFTVESDSVLGTRITMKKAGKLDVSATYTSATAFTFSVSKNQTNLTSLAPTSESIAFQSNDGTFNSSISGSTLVEVGDVIRVSCAANPTGTPLFTLAFQEQEIAVSVSNTLPQFSESDSSVRLSGTNGYGSTATTTRRFSTVVQNLGTDIEYVDSATFGGRFIIKTDGVYGISYSEVTTANTTAAYAIIRLNGASIAVNTDKVTTASTSEKAPSTSWQGYLVAGDVITAEVASPTDNNGAAALFTISKVGKPNVTGVDVTPFVNVPQPESQSFYQFGQTLLSTTGTIRFPTTGTTQSGSGIFSYNDATGVFTFLKRASLSLSVGLTPTTVGNVFSININGIEVGRSLTNSTANYRAVGSVNLNVNVGDALTISTGATIAQSAPSISVSATALSDQILTAPETFSTDTAALRYASSSLYNLTTLANAPVGTYITFTYAANTNTRTQTTTRPTQTDADMNANGIRIFTRAFNAASTAGNPAAIAIQIGKGLKGRSLDLYKSAGKLTGGNPDRLIYNSTVNGGLSYRDYNEVTGILYVDAAGDLINTNTTNVFIFSNESVQTSGYLVFNASKNASLTGMNIERVSARAVNSSGQSIANNSYTIVTYDAVKTFDTNSGLNTSTGVFTAPETGYYQVNAGITFAAFAVAASVQVIIHKNGSSTPLIGSHTTTSNTNSLYGAYVSDVVYLAKSETLDMRAYQNTGTARALSTSTGFNFFSIAKVNIGGK